MNATSIEPARPASEHLVSLSHHSYLIRSVSGSDELALFDMFSRSSPEDLRLRCLGMIKDFPRLAAARLARCDRDREIALVAVDGEGAAPGEIVGVAHLIEEPAEPGCAEFDILVRTDVKSHGVGFQLMKDVLARARERRLTKIVGFIAGENHAMLLMATELGFVRDHAEMGTVRVTAML
jgi:acetyltransferase